ncbi:hypothetical protein LK540_13375, partial [Massilia sp. IC2-278]|nr:hypothetical protein [Massilia sp. IC2-278]
MSSSEQVVAQMAEYGMPPLPAGHPKMNGKFQRFGPEKKGWYILRELTLDSGRTVVTGAFGFFQGENRNTVPVKIDTEAMSDGERQEYVRRQRDVERAEEEKRQEEARLAANRARDQWRKAEGIPLVHPYLDRKQVAAEGLRVGQDGKLLIPLVRDGQLLGLQKIDPTGDKKLNKGMDAVGVMHALGHLERASVIAVGEGYATCKTARDSVAPGYDLPVVVALNAGNILAVARWLRKRYPEAHLLFLADDDYLLVERFAKYLLDEFKISAAVPIDEATHRVTADDGQVVEVMARWRTDAQGISFIDTDVRKGRAVRTPKFSNAGLASCHSAAKAVGNASVAKPLFAIDRGGRKLTDFNDLQIEEGIDQVAAQIGLALLAAQQRKTDLPTLPAQAAEVVLQPGSILSLAAEQRNTDIPAPSAQAAKVAPQPATTLSLAAEQRNTDIPAPSAQAAKVAPQPATTL